MRFDNSIYIDSNFSDCYIQIRLKQILSERPLSMDKASLSRKPIPITVRYFLWLNLLVISVLLFGSCSLFVTKPEQVPTGIIDADDPNIQYIGRFHAPDPKNRVFDWPGVQICAKFQGTSCFIRLTEKKMNTRSLSITVHLEY